MMPHVMYVYLGSLVNVGAGTVSERPGVGVIWRWPAGHDRSDSVCDALAKKALREEQQRRGAHNPANMTLPRPSSQPDGRTARLVSSTCRLAEPTPAPCYNPSDWRGENRVGDNGRGGWTWGEAALIEKARAETVLMSVAFLESYHSVATRGIRLKAGSRSLGCQLAVDFPSVMERMRKLRADISLTIRRRVSPSWGWMCSWATPISPIQTQLKLAERPCGSNAPLSRPARVPCNRRSLD